MFNQPEFWKQMFEGCGERKYCLQCALKKEFKQNGMKRQRKI